MGITNSLKHGVDLPVWEWMSFLPVATAAPSACVGAQSGVTSRYIYYQSPTTFWRYDTWYDGWVQCATPNIAPTVSASLLYNVEDTAGYHGYVLSAGNAPVPYVVMGAMKIQQLYGQTIRIMSGTGMGQDRVVAAVQDAVVYDHGVCTTAGVASISDNTKKWSYNQWRGFQVRLVSNTGQSQMRTCLFNDTTTLYFYDINWQSMDPWNNTGFSIVAPYAAPVSTAGSQTGYVIEANTVVLSLPWTTVPDVTSKFCVLTGGIYQLSAVAGAPWSSLQYYDVVRDTWFTRTAIGGQITAILGTDWSIEKTGEAGGAYDTGTVTSLPTTRSLTISGKAWTVNQFANYSMRVTSGTGAGQRRKIISNSADTLVFYKPFEIALFTDSVIAIYGNTDSMYMNGNAAASMLSYSVEADMWNNGPQVDWGICRNGGIGLYGTNGSLSQEQIAITTIVRNTGGITVLNPTPTNGGTGYAVGDLFNITTGGTVGKGMVTSTTTGGVVASVSLISSGLTYTTGAGKSTTVISGSGSGTLTVNITTVGVVGRVTTAINHNFPIGLPIVFSGANEAAWNAIHVIIGVDSLLTFDVATTATLSFAASASQSVTQVVDSQKNWVVGEQVGRIVNIYTSGPSPTLQARRITANTATTLTLQAAVVLPVNGTSRYTIQAIKSYGRDQQWKNPSYNAYGVATGGSPTTLVDATKTWLTDQWAGYKLRIKSGTGYDKNDITIANNTATTLTLTAPGFTADTTTNYYICDSFGLSTSSGSITTLNDSAKNWTINMWAGKKLRLTSGTGQSVEATVLSNTATQITTTATMGVIPDNTTTYTILGGANKGAGASLTWMYNTGASAGFAGVYLMTTRGGASNACDVYNITTETWDQTAFYSPQTEVLGSGTMYCYDGLNTVYCQVGNTGRVIGINLLTAQVFQVGQLPTAMGAAIAGQRIAYVVTPDGLKFLYIMMSTGQSFWRTIIY